MECLVVEGWDAIRTVGFEITSVLAGVEFHCHNRNAWIVDRSNCAKLQLPILCFNGDLTFSPNKKIMIVFLWFSTTFQGRKKKEIHIFLSIFIAIWATAERINSGYRKQGAERFIFLQLLIGKWESFSPDFRWFRYYSTQNTSMTVTQFGQFHNIT